MHGLWIATAAVLFALSVALHEWGHAHAMRRSGIYVDEAGIGVPIPPRITLYRRSKPRPFRFIITPWLVGAYVKPPEKDEDRIEALPYRNFTWIMGSGVVINFVFGGALVALSGALTGRWLLALISAAAAVVIWIIRRPFAAYVMPVLALPLLGFIIWTIVGATGKPQGPLGVVRLLELATTFPSALLLAGVMSVSMGLFNTVPVFPLDGGRIFMRALADLRVPPRAVLATKVFSSVAVLGFFLYILATDVMFF